MATTTFPTTDAEIFAGVLASGAPQLNPEVARWLLAVRFTSQQQERMQELAGLGNEREMTASERTEAESYRRIGTMLSTLHSMARTALRPSVRSA